MPKIFSEKNIFASGVGIAIGIAIGAAAKSLYVGIALVIILSAIPFLYQVFIKRKTTGSEF